MIMYADSFQPNQERFSKTKRLDAFEQEIVRLKLKVRILQLPTTWLETRRTMISIPIPSGRNISLNRWEVMREAHALRCHHSYETRDTPA